jgi:signal transduction histidine kinase
MTAELELELRRLNLGSHVCLLFDDPADDWGSLVPYFREGLRRGERCEVVAGTEELSFLRRTLEAAGFDFEREVRRGALCEVDLEREVVHRFDADLAVQRLDRRVRQAMADGFSGLRSCAHLPHRLGGTDIDDRTMLELEARVNEFVSRQRMIMLCRYDMRNTRPPRMRQILRVHSLAVVGPLVCPNPFYEPPQMVLGECSEDDRVRWMIDQLCRSRAASLALEQSVQARDDFMAAASHELRTPLTSAQLNLQYALRAAETSENDRLSASWVAPKLRRAQEDMHRHVEVIQRLLDATQLREQRLQLNVESVDLVDAAKACVSEAEGRARQAHCALHMDAPRDPIVGAWDRMRLKQIVGDLLSNAIKFGAGKPVELAVSRVDTTARIVVRDHGFGIAPEDRTRIFERFERAAPISHYGGFGLGLWIVRKIVDAFGGDVVANNAPDGGAIFTVDLPLGAG